MGESNISSEIIRGHLDAIILRVLCEGDNYGYEIMKAIAKNSGGQYELKEPSLYTSLKRLEKQKQIVSYWGDETQGGRRKYYKVTPMGKEAYEAALESWKVAKAIIDQLIERQDQS
ncbi:PadR family transcriptional regulator [Brevibacillus sp. SIMBA_040]|uniref:PadR family transcriptional regulator n=1 Tax=unclassified Brevibacillus TaxID=2684853 RepID=UPI00397CD139